jgi:hypothetical protein
MNGKAFGPLVQEANFMATELRLMNTPELLDRAFFLYRKHFLLFIGIAVLPNLVLLMFQLVQVGMQSSSTTTAVMKFLALLITLLANLVTMSAVQAATVVAVSDVHLGRTSGIGAAYARMRDCWFDILLVIIIVGILVVIGFILLIVPGILIALSRSLAVPVAVIEKQGPLDSMHRSSQLTEGSRGAIFVILLLVSVINIVVSIIFQVPIAIVAGLSHMLGPNVGLGANVLIQIADFLSSTLVMPLSTIAISLVYYNQRVRKEGFDLQFMMSSLKSLPQTRPDAPVVS